MKLAFLPLGIALTTGLAYPAGAVVQDSQFPPQTVRDLIAVCAPAPDDPRMTAAINYCHGFAQGTVIVEIAHGEQRHGRKLFCLPNPRPPSGAELTSFVSWANQDPSRLDEPAVDGMFLYLAQKYPCKK
ncbi:Rap1a/Tai family immunity protein [Acidisphaera sp. S103]|uniref:Rap1a/Tai family immunity protein n=1 Tax=Acidisphaera sp. S103 TaxID=1747223 RepID=UPI00131BBE75|nr:Rap1a/Tai family immunity protein [Acidisphaera sp. S103]